MDRQRHRRRDEESDELRASAPRRDPADASDTESLLDLHARAGNRAVTELLGAHDVDAGGPSVQRDPIDGTPTATPADAKGPAGVGTMTFPDLKLDVPVQSVQRAVRGPGSKETAEGDLTVTLDKAHFDSRLVEAAAKGRHFDTITITIGSVTMTLHGVVISGVNFGSESVSLQLNFSSIEVAPGSSGEGKEPPPAYDLGK